ncbi:hypothetical protein TOPH_07490 [Tolypocladium ophioglossoides CBS 100239]|uniref:Uncharacterized protein n=1 Tax=Tolypocladium ophioglossoides (strain CBS 100239) TaxID=1163406 RepID=A0A0L0N159_TOLOC|nr:hypothetical protein TOPH_07490 [Tolypocladium ophioglossoides CBS 100239]
MNNNRPNLEGGKLKDSLMAEKELRPQRPAHGDDTSSAEPKSDQERAFGDRVKEHRRMIEVFKQADLLVQKRKEELSEEEYRALSPWKKLPSKEGVPLDEWGWDDESEDEHAASSGGK